VLGKNVYKRNLLSQVICNDDTIVVGDLNWDWLRPISDAFKEQCDILIIIIIIIHFIKKPN